MFDYKNFETPIPQLSLTPRRHAVQRASLEAKRAERLKLEDAARNQVLLGRIGASFANLQLIVGRLASRDRRKA